MAAVQGVTVSADLPGMVDRIAFESGAVGARRRRAGGARHAAGARAARGRRGAARAGARQLRAHAGAARTSASISQAEFDRATAEQRQTDARVGEIRAAIERKTIRAPFSGVLGIRHVNLGQYLAGGDALVTLQSLDPIYVNFGVPQQAAGQMPVGRDRPRHDGRCRAAPSSQRPHHRDRLGRRRATRNIQVQATLANPGGKLRPGMFVQTEVTLGASRAGHLAAGVGDQLRAVRRFGVRRRRAEGPDGQDLSRRAAAVRQAGRRARRSDRRGVRRQAGRRSRDLGRVQAAQRRRRPDQQQGAAGEQPEAEAGEQLMKFTDLFVKRPVLAIVVNLVILIAGLQSIRALSVRQYPRSDIAVVTVTTAYVGANADLVRGFITTPLERVIASADGIDYMESSSAQGLSTITVHLKLNYDTNAALTQIQAKVAQVRNDLPPEAEAPIIDLQTADNQFAAIYLGFSSTDLDPNQITDYLTRVVQPKLSAISGVQRADILGARTFAMRIWLKPDRDGGARHRAVDGPRRAGPQQLPVGARADQGIDGVGQPRRQHRSADTRGVPAARRQGAGRRRRPARRHRRRRAGRRELRAGHPLQRRVGDVHGRVGAADGEHARRDRQGPRGASRRSATQLPAGMKVGIPYDSTEYIQDAISEVLRTLTETLLIVIVVIFLFLGSFRSVLIPIVAIPISLVGAVFLMLVAGFTVNLLTLLAIVLSVGLVVDDAIVMVENVERHLHEGKRPMQAAIDAARELVGPIIAMTITLAAVYAPIGIQGGLTGSLFREFAFTLAGAVIVSGVVALTLSPMMAPGCCALETPNAGSPAGSTAASTACAAAIRAH